MDFARVADLFEQLEQTGSRLEMTQMLCKALTGLKGREVSSLTYLLQGQVAPGYKNVDFGIGEKFVMDAIARVSGYARTDVEKLYKEVGDLGEVAQKLVAEKKQKALFSETLTLEKVFTNLEKLSAVEGRGSQDTKISFLAELLNSSSPLEAKFIVRVPLERLRLGVGDPTLLDALAMKYLDSFAEAEPGVVKKLEEEYKKEEDVARQLKFALRARLEAAYNIRPDLGHLAALLSKKGLDGLKEIDITPGIPIRPTLAERLPSSEKIVEKLGICQVEAKYDGLRIQAHKDGDKVVLYSRRMEDMTHMFPDLVKAMQRQVKAKSAIMEGEALAYNEKEKKFYPFQITVQRKRKHAVKDFSEKYPLRFFLFDLMMLDGADLMGKPFKVRREKLEQAILAGSVMKLTEAIQTDDPKEIEEFFESSLKEGLEGIIAKDLDAPYIAGARKFAWIKLKKSYKGELADTVDAVVLGYYKGRGKRSQFGLGALLVGVYNPTRDRFETIAKIGTGMSEEQLSWFEKELAKKSVQSRPMRVISNLEPDVWVEPEIVVEIRADEITKSPQHTACREELGEGVALRFPRLISVREDRAPEQATGVEEVVTLFEQQGSAGKK